MNNHDLTITLTLPPGPAALLREMAEGTDRAIEEIAASLIIDVLADDKRCHEAGIAPVVAPADPIQMRLAKAVFSQGPRSKGETLQKKQHKQQRTSTTKTSAEIRHEARMKDPIVAESVRRGPGRPPGAKNKPKREPAPKPKFKALPVPVEAPKPAPILVPSSGFTPDEDERIRDLRGKHKSPYEIAFALKRDVNDVRRRIIELWSKK